MPLVIVTGLPTSGKSTRAKQLHAYFEERLQESNPPRYRLHLISDQSLSISRSVYDLSPSAVPAHTRSANASEKDARATIYGAVKRVLSDKDIVILDGLNYIKGWRYQLFCESKAVQTPSAVLRIGCSVDRARGVNEKRLAKQGRFQSVQQGDSTTKHVPVAPEQNDTYTTGNERDVEENGQGTEEQGEEGQDAEEGYELSNWENLVFRYEEPNPMTRWDSPLFALIWEDDKEMARQVFSQVWDAIAGSGRRTVRPNQATVQRSRDVGGDYLYVLDRETQAIVKEILDHQQQQQDETDGEVRLAKSENDDGTPLVVSLPMKKVGVAQLQRLRRGFVGLNRGGIGLEGVGSLAAGRIRQNFVNYLNDSFERDE